MTRRAPSLSPDAPIRMVGGRAQYFVLKDRVPVPTNLWTWATSVETNAGRHVGDDTIERPGAQSLRVSTIFLGLDHSFGDGPPVLFETMVFGDTDLDYNQVRYSTYDEAEAGHKALVEWARREQELTSQGMQAVLAKAKGKANA